ncbi:MAG: isochorismatase family protein [Casimicrobiaceae bacterium]
MWAVPPSAGSGRASPAPAGQPTSICIESTIRDAMFRDYACLLLEDCTAEPIGNGPGRSNHEASLLSIKI